MSGTRIASSEAVAQTAITNISKVTIPNGKNTSLSKSTVPSMKAGVELSNQILSDLKQLVVCVQKQADKFPELAKVMAERDREQKFEFGGK
ncbi:hypothetical protein [Enterococcus faecium]|uniref:TIGR04197 family type VII secretion effector n=1 Tax=Enterococcus faecium TaxID=1352 RepID=A0AB73NHX6_ENTFC|nr:hypothetical protein [Enterococcus faecium]EIP8061745.1 hypothetical protein [Enterococcus faecalis]EKZ0111185.1 hypothetical protein [Enterococcus faecalis]OTN98591.1 hypothetical protein A5804_000074 [Enterococcus faecium]